MNFFNFFDQTVVFSCISCHEEGLIMRIHCAAPNQRTGRLRRAARRIILSLLGLALIFLLLERNLETVILDMASARAEAMAVEYIHEAVRDVMEDTVTYEDMMNVQTDAQGRVTMLQANAVRMNWKARSPSPSPSRLALRWACRSCPRWGRAFGCALYRSARCPQPFPRNLSQRGSIKHATKFIFHCAPPFVWSSPAARGRYLFPARCSSRNPSSWGMCPSPMCRCLR